MGWSRVFRRDRWRTVLAFWAVEALVLHTSVMLIVPRPDTPWLERFEGFFSPELLLSTGPIALVIAACQAVLLMPASPAVAVAHSAARVWLSRVVCGIAVGGTVAIATFGAGLPLEQFAGIDVPHGLRWGILNVAVGFAAALGTIVWLATTAPQGVPVWVRTLVAGAFGALGAGALAASACALTSELQNKVADFDSVTVVGSIVAAITVSWVAWTPLLVAFLRRPAAESRLARLARAVFGGSLVHAGALVPLDVMVRKRDSCYCGEASFWSLTGTIALGLFALGPAIFLVPFATRRAALRKGFCVHCGYDLTTLPEPKVCPECGPDAAPGRRYTPGP